MPVCDDEADCDEALASFFHEMGDDAGAAPAPPVDHDLGACPTRRRRSSWSRAARSDRRRRRVPDRLLALEDGRPRLTTVRTRSAAGQYGIWSTRRDPPDDEVGLLAGLERADVVAEPERMGGVDRRPRRAPRPASARGSRQATVITSGRLAVGDVPGLKSVPSATGIPRSMNVRAGAPRRLHQEPGRRGQERSRRPAGRSAAAAASASIPAGDGAARWSADSAPSSAASSAPPDGASSSAWSRGASRAPRAASRIRRAWSAREDAPLAEDVAEAGPPLGRDARQLLVEDGGARTPRPGPRRSRNSGGTAWAPRHVGTTSTGPSWPSWWATSRSRSSVREVEPVAGLRLDRRRPVREHLVEPAPAVGQEVVGRRGPRRGDGRRGCPPPAARISR